MEENISCGCAKYEHHEFGLKPLILLKLSVQNRYEQAMNSYER
jgi:hypothetical protein